jgi:uncharacterized protein YerC
MILKGRDKMKGSKNANSILDEIKVQQIKKLLIYSRDLEEIAKKFGVCRATISQIKRGFTWSSV